MVLNLSGEILIFFFSFFENFGYKKVDLELEIEWNYVQIWCETSKSFPFNNIVPTVV